MGSFLSANQQLKVMARWPFLKIYTATYGTLLKQHHNIVSKLHQTAAGYGQGQFIIPSKSLKYQLAGVVTTDDTGNVYKGGLFTNSYVK